VIEPSIRASRDGFKVPEDLAVRFTPDREFLTKDPAWAMDFAPNGKTLEVGDIITQRRLADTLETIAKSGADAFYVGPIAEATVNALRKSDGIMTTDDLANYKVEVREALEIDYRGFKVASTTAPSSGPITLSILNILDEYNDFYASGTVNLSTHRLDEAMRFAYGQVGLYWLIR
jgi:gamma-glutamyltranspeptidase/glutathione hydrolase